MIDVAPATAVSGALAVPGDKSITHRGLLLGAIAEGESEIRGALRAGDTDSTVRVLRQLGVEVDDDGTTLRVRGVALGGDYRSAINSSAPQRVVS